MARPSKHDGGLYKRKDGKVWWMRYRDRDGNRRRESTLTEDWREAQKRLRERLQARDNNTLSALRRKGRTRIWGMGGLLSGELLQAADSRGKDSRGQRARAEAPEKACSRPSSSRILTADDIEMYLRRRLKQRVHGEGQGWVRSKGCAEGNDGASGVAGVASHVECGGTKKFLPCESMCGR